MHADRPTLVVPDRFDAEPDPDLAVLVGVDEQDPKPERFAQALRLVALQRMVVMHAAQARIAAARVSEGGRLLSSDEITRLVAEDNEAAQRTATAVAEEAAAWLNERTGRPAEGVGVATPGGPWQGIVDRSEASDIGMVVVGSRGRGAVQRTALGSISNGVVHHARKPVLVVP